MTLIANQLAFKNVVLGCTFAFLIVSLVLPALFLMLPIFVDKVYIMQRIPCNEYPLTPHFNIVILGFTGVCLIFLFLL